MSASDPSETVSRKEYSADVPQEIVRELEDIPEELRPRMIEKVHAIIAAYSGPLPPPSVLAGYEQIKRGTAERVIAMAERQAAHRQTMEQKLVEAEIEDHRADRRERRLGQWLGFSIGSLAILAGSLTATYGNPWAGGLIGAGGVVGLVSVFVLGRRAEKEEQKAAIGSDAAPSIP